MEKPKLSSNLLVALSSLVATIVSGGFIISIVLSGRPDGPPLMALSMAGANVFLGILFFPLLWWRHAAGHIGAIGVGIMALIGNILGLRDVLTGEQPVEAFFVIIVALAIYVVLIVSSAAAWREKT